MTEAEPAELCRVFLEDGSHLDLPSNTTARDYQSAFERELSDYRDQSCHVMIGGRIAWVRVESWEEEARRLRAIISRMDAT